MGTNDGNSDSTTRLNEVIRLVRTYQDGLSRTFLLIATELPKIYSSTKTLLAHDGGAGGGDARSVCTCLKESREVATTVRSELIFLMNSNQRALTASERLASASAEIASIVQAVGRVGWTLSLTGLNASVMAAHTGNEGLAFSTLTHALTRLADESAKQARALRSAATHLAGQGIELASGQAANAKEHRIALEGAEDHLLRATEGIADSVVAITETVDDARTRTEAAVATIVRIMAAVQREDILRQKIDHLLLVLEEAHDVMSLGGEQTLESAAFIEQSAELSSGLWEEISADGSCLLSDILESFEHLRPAIELGDLRLEAVEALRSRALAPMRELRERLATLEQSPRTDLAKRAELLGHGISQVGTSLDEIHDCTRQLAVLHVLVRIEVARTPKLATAGTIAAQIAEATEQLRELVATSFQANALLNTQLKLMQATAKELERGDRTVSMLHMATAQRTSELDAAGDALAAHLQYVRSIGRHLRTNATTFEEEIQRFHSVSRQTEIVMGTLARLREDASRVVASSSAHERPPVSPRMLELVDRFTVLSHKTIAARIVDINVEAGDPAGELTLF